MDMPYTLDFNTVLTVGLESSPVAAALAGFVDGDFALLPPRGLLSNGAKVANNSSTNAR